MGIWKTDARHTAFSIVMKKQNIQTYGSKPFSFKGTTRGEEKWMHANRVRITLRSAVVSN